MGLKRVLKTQGFGRRKSRIKSTARASLCIRRFCGSRGGGGGGRNLLNPLYMSSDLKTQNLHRSRKIGEAQVGFGKKRKRRPKKPFQHRPH